MAYWQLHLLTKDPVGSASLGVGAVAVSDVQQILVPLVVRARSKLRGDERNECPA
jgi:hypothetical protein